MSGGVAKTAVVTGAGRGLGLAFAIELSSRGWRVFATTRSAESSPGLRALQQRVGELVVPVTLDVADPASIGAAAKGIRQCTASLDLLVNNAGVNSRSVLLAPLLSLGT